MKDFKQIALTLIFIALVGSATWAIVQPLLVVYPQPVPQATQPFKAVDLDFLVGMTAFSIAVVTFFGVLRLNRSAPDQALIMDAERLRTALACSLVITYLYIVCFTTFVRSATETGGVTQSFIQSFSNVIGIAVAFYFGASAATQIFAGKNGQTESKRPDST